MLERKAKLKRQKETQEEDEVDSDGTDVPGPEDALSDAESANSEIEGDKWIVAGNNLIRIHNKPRSALFVPKEDECPIPLRYLDVCRKTQTNILDKAESEIDDYWIQRKNIHLTSEWTGRTMFDILKPKARMV